MAPHLIPVSQRPWVQRYRLPVLVLIALLGLSVWLGR